MLPQTSLQLREYEMALAHTPVLLDELIELLRPRRGDVAVFGAAYAFPGVLRDGRAAFRAYLVLGIRLDGLAVEALADVLLDKKLLFGYLI